MKILKKIKEIYDKAFPEMVAIDKAKEDKERYTTYENVEDIKSQNEKVCAFCELKIHPKEDYRHFSKCLFHKRCFRKYKKQVKKEAFG